MGRPKRGRKIQKKHEPLNSDEELENMKQPDPNSSEYFFDDIDKYHAQKEKILLDTHKTQHGDPEEDEVLQLKLSDEEDDDDDDDDGFHSRFFSSKMDKDDMASDLEGNEDDDLPDPKAWGKRKSVYYSTDYVDQDFGGFEGSDGEAAVEEEKEALELQKQLLSQLDEEDFGLELFKQPTKPKAADTSILEEVIERDLSKLPKKEKLELLHRESPEFSVLIDDFKGKISEIQDSLFPLTNLIKTGKLPANPATEFISIKTEVILNYCINICFYLVLKSQRISVQNHPVLKRLTNFRKMFLQMAEIDDHLKPEIDELLKQLKVEGDIPLLPSPAKKLKKLQRLTAFGRNDNQEEEQVDVEEVKKNRIKLPTDELLTKQPEQEENVSEEEADDQADTEPTDGKRSITYQIAKNKGLTPHRKKEQRNPRVKHRMKFRKAKIRRKGQVREARKELSRYGGEISGIKIGISKSIKLS